MLAVNKRAEQAFIAEHLPIGPGVNGALRHPEPVRAEPSGGHRAAKMHNALPGRAVVRRRLRKTAWRTHRRVVCGIDDKSDDRVGGLTGYGGTENAVAGPCVTGVAGII